ncbi:zf-HC2 domain-containing protein [Nitrosomonas sp. JL21]|uniref:zf-HC2 domain-containing protein n=1 Tax=Nitrosomonas sp. JL21 TaxID=153949 RepID=UPI00136C2C92|nr:zf-HC2 domain-containing protein [Nitrosomonas sp. JL21]MBL8496310.1 zf-HC2 domain-containing protein [Nitrosomonas sp.]MCC7091787.1 zf-HC2 domain-containing protein [Nitrosomonas sp.]MXS77887.1 zf-HC2 domain-containing protein [Nitrosomonas sp. JL21]
MFSSNDEISTRSEHQKVWNLLPWYINNTLDPVEQASVRHHVKFCITCRIELDQQQQLVERMQQIDLLEQVSQVSFAQLKMKIEKQPSVGTLTQPHEAKKDSKFFSQQFLSFVQYTALAASLLLLSLPFMLGSLIDRTELGSDYRTLANTVVGEESMNMLRVVFSDQSDPEQISAILNAVSAQIVKGPSDNGVYLVQIGDQLTHPQDIQTAIAYLHNDTRVIFAELAHGLSSADRK